MKFERKLNKVADDINKYLKKIVLNEEKKSSLLKSMKYGLFSGGKRFRSAILVNAGKIFKIDYRTLITVGAVVECIHSYSLIHDDLPAMDNDDLRRGKLSTHKKFNEFTAILAGNCLLTLAFEILSSKKLKLKENKKISLIKELSNCSGHAGLAGGQYSDLTFENKKISTKNIILMQKKKTGKLFGFCCESVAIIKGKSIKERKFLKEIGSEIGLLFQIADDLIDYKGNTKIAGKPTKRDAEKGKATLVNLIGYEKTLIFAKKLKNKIRKKIKKYGKRSEELLLSIDFILDREF